MEQVRIEMHRSGEGVRIAVTGPFNFSARRSFAYARDASLQQAGTDAIRVDLRRATHIDSAALGMLLILHDRARDRGRPVAIDTEPGIVREILEVARFGERFTLQ